MQVLRSLEHHSIAPVGLSIRVMLIGASSRSSILAERLAQLGGAIDAVQDLFAGLESVIEDPAGYGLCVIDCDAIGGLVAGRRAHSLLGDISLRVPVILVSGECEQQEFPQERGKPVVLRAAASSLSVRVGFEHALRDRFMIQFS